MALDFNTHNKMSKYTKFENCSFTVDQILSKTTASNNGIAEWNIPEMQRQFVWKDKQIISFLNSLFMGYPVGAILYWDKAIAAHHSVGKARNLNKVISQEESGLIIDGQQRITSLKIIFEGMPIERGKVTHNLRIQFNPTLDASLSDNQLESPRFKTLSRRTKIAPKCVDILEMLYEVRGANKIFRTRQSEVDFKNKYLKENPNLTEDEIKNFHECHGRLLDVYNAYEIPAVKLKKDTTHEEAAEIFVRINNSGTRLDMANFIMTSLALNDQHLKDAIHEFAENSAKTAIYELEPIGVLSAMVSYTFGEPLGKNAYEILEGKDNKKSTKKEIEKQKRVNLALLKNSLKKICVEKHWDDFIDAVREAGICSKKYLASEAALLAAYSIYIHMVNSKGVAKEVRKNAISLWLLFCSLTRRYSSHTDSVTREDLGKFRNLKSAGEIIEKIYSIIDEKISSDDVIYQAAREAENILTICLCQQNKKALFSQLTIRQIIEGVKKGGTKLDEHHLFPINFMRKVHKYSSEDIEEKVDVCSNLAPITASENREIGDDSPADYAPGIKKRYEKVEWKNMCESYGLPDNWWTLKFEDFSKQRQSLLPKVIRKSLDDLRTYKA